MRRPSGTVLGGGAMSTDAEKSALAATTVIRQRLWEIAGANRWTIDRRVFFSDAMDELIQAAHQIGLTKARVTQVESEQRLKPEYR